MNNYIANLDCELVENALIFVLQQYRYKQPVALPDPKTEWAEETQFISSGWGTRRRNIPGICSRFHSGQYTVKQGKNVCKVTAVQCN